ncbi:prepilin-type N-terminal cleavage/methylation domain-containing protein [Thermodesulfovibrionales bacterium]|nr:prepilin-type N-terminal cleavage/methylation domain-containing protein [Thermodesulfovibrionales bacterium]
MLPFRHSLQSNKRSQESKSRRARESKSQDSRLTTLRLLTHNRGFSLIEMLISMAILGILLAAIATIVYSQNKHHAAQNEIVEMQNNARMAMDFVTRKLRGAVADDMPGIFGVDIGGTSGNSTLRFFVVEDTGRATGGTEDTLTDDAKDWGADDPNWRNYRVAIVGGTGAGQRRVIESDEAEKLKLDTSDKDTTDNTSADAWDPPYPDNTSEYRILSFHRFERDAVRNILRYGKNQSRRQPLAENITAFTVTRDGSRVDITITAQTANKLPTTNKYGTMTLESSVFLRN